MAHFTFVEHLCKRNNDTGTAELSSNSTTPSSSILCTDITTIGCTPRTRQTILSVSYADRTIAFFDIDGRQQASKTIRNKTYNAHLLKWRPSSTSSLVVVALAFSNGIVSLWNYCFSDRSSPAQWISNTNDFPSPAITALLWNNAGTQLAVGNQAGSCSLWRFDEEQLSLFILAEYGSVEYHSITEAVFYQLPQVSMGRMDNNCFLFFGTSNGVVVKADSQKNHSILESTASSIEKLLIYEEKQRLVILTKSFTLLQVHIGPDNSCDILTKLKLNVLNQNTMILKNAIWVGPGIIASAGGERMVRFWDILTHRNYILPLDSTASDCIHDHSRNAENVDVATCIAFQSQTGYLSTATSTGVIILWKLRASGPALNSCNSFANDNDCKQQTPWNPVLRHRIVCLGDGTSAAVQMLYCLPDGHAPLLLSAVTDNSASFAHQLELKYALHHRTAAIQLSRNTIKVQHICKGKEACSRCFTLQGPDSQIIEGLTVNEENLVFWGKKSIYVYQFRNEQWEYFADFSLPATSVALYREFIFILLEDKILLTTKDGARRLSLPLSVDKVGRPVSMSLMKNFLLIATDHGFLKVLDVSHKDPSPVGLPVRLNAAGHQPALDQPALSTAAPFKILSISSNSTGNLTSLLVKESNDPKALSCLHLVNVISGDQRYVEFGGEVRRHFWDQFEPTLLCCEVETSEMEVIMKVFFVLSDLKTYCLDEFKVESNRNCFFFGAVAPELFYAEATGLQHDVYNIKSVILKDFIGHDLSDVKGSSLLLQLAFSITVGDYDKEYQSVLQIEADLSVWEKMAHLSVRKRQQDFVDICLAKMGHATGIAAVNLAKKEPEKNVALAVAAVQLGLLNEADALYKACGRYDLLAELYMGQGLWEEAFRVSEEHDRINSKYFYHQHAQYCCALGDIKGAISSFEKAGTHAVMVPRMLMKHKLFDELRDYVNKKADKKITVWWASYCESIGDLDQAAQQYETAGDIANFVRLACKKGDWSAASHAVLNSGNSSAAYQLAVLYEKGGKMNEAFQFYVKSGVLRQAIRLCKGHAEASDELVKLALKTDSVSFVLDCATFFHERGHLGKAAELFHKGGQTARALSLCVAVPQSIDLIRKIVSTTRELTPSDSEVCSKLCIQSGMYNEAAQILFRHPSTFHTAIQISLEHNILVTDDIISKVIAFGASPQFQENVKKDEKWNITSILAEFGELCERQGKYLAGCKVYTKAGEHSKAMNCLLQGNDIQAIISYAFASRVKENYVLAANYLQSVQ
jgi:intraflagellar transport protein 140